MSEKWADLEYAVTVRWVRDERVEQLRLALRRRGVCVQTAGGAGAAAVEAGPAAGGVDVCAREGPCGQPAPEC